MSRQGGGRIVKLGDICEFKYGKSLPEPLRLAGPVPVFGSNGAVGSHSEPLSTGATVIVGRKGSFGEVHYSDRACWPIDTTYYVDSASSSVDLRWLARCLRTLGLKRLNRAAAVPGLNREDAYQLTVRLPDVSEQHRIADILDKADALSGKRRASLAQFDALKESVFLDMFRGSSPMGKQWPIRSIGDLCEVRGGKRLPKGEEYSPLPTPYRYIRVTDLRGGTVDESALVYLKPAVQSKIRRYTVSAGDVIISIAGSIGITAVVGKSLDGANLTENAAKLAPRHHGVYAPEYLSAFLTSASGQAQIGSATGQVTIGKLALFRIEKIQLPLPPIELQRRFAGRLSEISALRLTLTRSAHALDALFASLQHRAFRGEL